VETNSAPGLHKGAYHDFLLASTPSNNAPKIDAIRLTLRVLDANANSDLY
jgi:hypothetical protein